jgi:hypothetical protein
MQRLCLVIAVLGALSLGATGAIAGAPPLVNQTDHPVGAALVPEVGIDCGTGQATLISGSYSGVIHTLIQADGTVHINGAVRGSAINDDLRADGTPDGTPDATTTFVSTFRDIFRASGGEAHTLTLDGSGTTTSTGTGFRFHVLIQTLIDENGDPKIDIFQFRCF